LETAIEPRIILQAADKIRSFGERIENGYVLEGITLVLGPDEYVIELRSLNVSLNLYFHNKFKVDALKQSDLEMFYGTVERIARTDYRLC
jgi:hypothetical protein